MHNCLYTSLLLTYDDLIKWSMYVQVCNPTEITNVPIFIYYKRLDYYIQENIKPDQYYACIMKFIDNGL